jgi:hypothetical protein
VAHSQWMVAFLMGLADDVINRTRIRHSTSSQNLKRNLAECRLRRFHARTAMSFPIHYSHGRTLSRLVLHSVSRSARLGASRPQPSDDWNPQTRLRMSEV